MIQDFFISIWEGIVFIVYMLVIIVMIPFSGTKNTLIKDCVPKLEYVSTNDTAFSLGRTLDKTLASRGYDPLDLLDTNQDYLDIHMNLANTGFKKGTKLKLLGDIIDRKPKGIVKANNSRMIYIKAKIESYTVWFPMYQLKSFNNGNSDINIENNKLINLPEKWSDREKWSCPL